MYITVMSHALSFRTRSSSAIHALMDYRLTEEFIDSKAAIFWAVPKRAFWQHLDTALTKWQV